MAYPFIIAASFIIGLTRPHPLMLLFGPALCVVIAILSESGSTDMPGLSSFLGLTGLLAALVAGPLGYGIATLIRRRR